MGFMRTEETICAPATGSGGAIALIRISGSKSFYICEKIFFPLDKSSKPSVNKGFTVMYGDIRDGDEIIDDVLLSIFRAPHSYTGENSIEISCHASPYIQRKILELLIQNGAVPALPGEFTQRAFMNGRMDPLIQNIRSRPRVSMQSRLTMDAHCQAIPLTSLSIMHH